MKKLFGVLLLFTLAVFAGCLTDSSSDDENDYGEIYGYVKSSDESGIRFVTMTLYKDDTAVSTATTNSYGYYVFSDINNGTYRVIPSKGGYTFSPSEVRNVVVSGGRVSVQNITGAPTY